jgi:hypothetical protein
METAKLLYAQLVSEWLSNETHQAASEQERRQRFQKMAQFSLEADEELTKMYSRRSQ